MSANTWDEVRQAWANNETVQYRDLSSRKWVDWPYIDRITRSASDAWRVKPSLVKVRMAYNPEDDWCSHNDFIGVYYWIPGRVEPQLGPGELWIGPWQELPE